jgi:LmbE family N-acetylglucosaminyl deacetylase
MVIPLVNEIAWAELLKGLRDWQPACVDTVVVVPHPDDETLATGGLIAWLRSKGADVTVVAVTAGENAYADNEGLAALRSLEQTCALERLGLAANKIVRLGLVDSNVAAQEDVLAANLRLLIRANTQVVAPWIGDFHPDHEACARAAALVAGEAGATLISYFFWTWHRGTVSTLDGVELKKFVFGADLCAAKRDALACHASQLAHAPEPEVLPEDLLWPARMAFEVFAL